MESRVICPGSDDIQLYIPCILDLIKLFGVIRQYTYYISDISFVNAQDARLYMEQFHPTLIYQLQPVTLKELCKMPFFRIVTDPAKRQPERIKGKHEWR